VWLDDSSHVARRGWTVVRRTYRQRRRSEIEGAVAQFVSPENALARIVETLDEDRAASAKLKIQWPQLILVMDEARTALARTSVEVQLSETSEAEEQEQYTDMPQKKTETETSTETEWKSWSTVVLKKRGAKTNVEIYGPTSSKKVAEAAVKAFGNGTDNAIVVQNMRMPKLNELRRIADTTKKRPRAVKT
jgi:hypothetical protein